MPATDRNILRVAVFEMRHEKPALAAGVAINEAVEIAKLMEPKNLRALLTVF